MKQFRFTLKRKKLNFNNKLFIIPAILLIILGIIFYDQNYTFTVSIFAAAFFIGAILFNESLLDSRNFWITMLIGFLPFLIVNYFLTSIPVVTYNEAAFSGKRFITIPYEDFLYSFSMISLWILFYELAKEKKKVKKKICVIGAGLGGLSAAIRLANKGFEVDLYEQNNTRR
ncbi:MAG: lycopene cyclase domain-containing protein [Ignavibacteriales bacterium]|nr:lycopene cyclase domain-containing protein [Ignavibacteriales bacterium]